MSYIESNYEFRFNFLNRHWCEEHDYQLNYPREGDVFDICHQRFTNEKEWLFGLFGKWHEIREITEPR